MRQAMSKTVFLVTRNGLGSVAADDAAFGVEMFDSFLHALESELDSVEAICFYTEGVRLVTRGSRALPGLQLLAGLGARLVACRTCLARYGLLDDVAVGEIGTMKDIVRLMTTAGRVVTV
jgi:hypothetical protein